MDGNQKRTEFTQKQRSISKHCDEEDELSSWDPQQPPPGGDYGNYFLELIIIWKLFLGTDLDMQ